jgi:DNA replication and repair protein RecF
MIRVDRLVITQFKNYQQVSFDFPNRITGICGLNGVGKTNLLDALYYCCFTRSYFTATDTQNIRFNTDGFRLAAQCHYLGANEELVCIHRGNGKSKSISLNGVPYPKFSQHIGHYPAVMIAPDDIDIITGSSEERRKYLDTLFAQFDAAYLDALIQYNRILTQRNSLLKQLAEQPHQNLTLLDVYDEQLIPIGQALFEKRKAYTEELVPDILELYSLLASKPEAISVRYKSALNDQPFDALLARNRSRDLFIQRTSVGVHKDDLVCLLDDQPFKQTASQGQRKSLLFALKLAEYRMLQHKKGFAPLLFLDDVFEKLDAHRMQNLLDWVAGLKDAQVFITDTHEDRLHAALSRCTDDYAILDLGGESIPG